jgi:dihydroxyacetone kinase-like protein
MKKLINNIDDLLIDSLKGFARAHSDIVGFNAQPA